VREAKTLYCGLFCCLGGQKRGPCANYPATSSLYSREKSSVYCTLLTRNLNCRVTHPGISAETIFGALLFNPGCRADTVLFWALYYSVCNSCIAVSLCVLYSVWCVREWLGCAIWNFFTVAIQSVLDYWGGPGDPLSTEITAKMNVPLSLCIVASISCRRNT
jgi:hypothetical protein